MFACEQMAWEALSALTRTLDAERQIQHVSDVRQAVRYAAADLQPGDLLPGFCLPKVLKTPHIIVFMVDLVKLSVKNVFFDVRA